MKTSCSLAVALACLASVGLCADHTLTYATGDTSLGDGLLTFENSGDTITKIVANVPRGDRVVLKGDALSFGEGATIETAGLGNLVIENELSGTDGLLVTNTSAAQLVAEWWGDELLSNTDYSTIFTNVDLDNVELVESDEKAWRDRERVRRGDSKYNFSNPQLMMPYWARRETVDGAKTMFAQFQCYIDGVVKCVKLELKQDGADIVGRAPDCGYVRTNDTFNAAYLANTVLGDDFDALRDSWNADPDDTVNPQFQSSRYYIGQLTVRRKDVPYVNFANSDSSPSLGGALKVAANARARRVGVSGFDVDVTLEVDGLWEGGERNSSQTAAIKGTGGTLAVVAEKPGHANPFESRLKNFVTTSATSVDSAFDNNGGNLLHSLFDLTNIPPCIIVGRMMTWFDKNGNHTSGYNIATPHHWRVYTNGVNSYATVQMQGSNSTKMVRCSILKFQQSTYAVNVSLVTNIACYTPKNNASYVGYVGMDFEDPDVLADATGKGLYTDYKSNTSERDATPFSVSNLVCQFSEPTEYLFTVNKTNAMKNARLVVEGNGNDARALANANGVDRLPLNGDVEIREGGALNISVGSSAPDAVSQNTSARITVHSGGVLRTWGSVQDSAKNSDSSKRKGWAYNRNQSIRLLGGRMMPSFMHGNSITHSYCYLNNLTLADGARIESDIPIWLGNSGNGENARWLVRGSSAPVVDSPVVVVGSTSPGLYDFRIDVADVSEGSDLVMAKPISRFTSDENHKNFCLNKHGEGTMEIRDSIDVPQGVRICGGALKLAGSGLTDGSSQAFKLDGGAIEAADGTSNACGALSVSSRGGKIVLGEGASLSFADSSESDWAAGASVVVSGFREGAITFGTSVESVPRARGVFRTEDGARLRVDDDGNLTAKKLGLTVLFK